MHSYSRLDPGKYREVGLVIWGMELHILLKCLSCAFYDRTKTNMLLRLSFANVDYIINNYKFSMLTCKKIKNLFGIISL